MTPEHVRHIAESENVAATEGGDCMKRSSKFIALAAGIAAAISAAPAFAQYEEDAAGAAVGMGILACYGIVILLALAFFVWWIIMVIDVFKRQEYEFPGSTGSSKTLWIVVLLVGWALGFHWLVAPIYYFMIYKKGPKPGTGIMPAASGGYPAPAAPSAPPASYPPPPSAPAARHRGTSTTRASRASGSRARCTRSARRARSSPGVSVSEHQARSPLAKCQRAPSLPSMS